MLSVVVILFPMINYLTWSTLSVNVANSSCLWQSSSLALRLLPNDCSILQTYKCHLAKHFLRLDMNFTGISWFISAYKMLLREVSNFETGTNLSRLIKLKLQKFAQIFHTIKTDIFLVSLELTKYTYRKIF